MPPTLTIFVDCAKCTGIAVVRDGEVVATLELNNLTAIDLQRRFDALQGILRDHCDDSDDLRLVCEAPWGGLQVNTYGVLMQHVGVWQAAAKFLDIPVGESVVPATWRVAWGIRPGEKREAAKEAAVNLVRDHGLWPLPTKRADNIAEAILGAIYVDRERRGVPHPLRLVRQPPARRAKKKKE